MTEPTREQPSVTPTVTTAPARSRWHMSRIPPHLGPARTSTVVLAALFLAIGTLYLNIRPEPTGATTTGSNGGAGVEVPAGPTTAAPTTAEPTTPAPTSTAPTTTSDSGATATTEQSTPTAGPTEVTTPTATTGATAPTTTASPTRPVLPSTTVTSPAG